MGKTKKSKRSWQECRKTIKHKWLRPFIFVEWLCERASGFLKKLAIFEILEYAGRLAIVVAVIFYFSESKDRQKAKHYQAWQVINSAQGKPGSGGRIDALQDLASDGVSLGAIDVSKAELQCVNLEQAYLWHANLSGVLNWQSIQTIEHANIYGIEDANAPKGFREWAIKKGAVNIEGGLEWIEARNKWIQAKDSNRQEEK